MADVTVKRVDEMPRSFGGAFIHARAALESARSGCKCSTSRKNGLAQNTPIEA